jgi:glycosyltransferase involved in cell wall biosynthesis
MDYLIIMNGMPSLKGEDAFQKPYLLIKKLYLKKSITLVSIVPDKYYYFYKKKKFFDIDNFLFMKKFKSIKLIKIYKKNNNTLCNFFDKLKKIFFSKEFFFYSNKNTYLKINEIIKKIKPKKILCLYDPAIISCVKYSTWNCEKISFTGQISFKNLETQLENYKKKNIFSKITDIYTYFKLFFLIFKSKFLFKRIFENFDKNIFHDQDTYLIAKKLKIPNVKFIQQFTPDFGGDNWIKKRQFRKKKNILFLNSAPTTININAVDNFIKYTGPFLNNIKINNNDIFNYLYVVGENNFLVKKIMMLNYPWIKFTGWSNNISKEFFKNNCILLTNDLFLNSRTKIFHAMSAGLITITLNSNTYNHKKLINKKNILIAKNINKLNEVLFRFLNNEYNEKKMSINARQTFEKYYSEKNNVSNIIRYLESASK